MSSKYQGRILGFAESLSFQVRTIMTSSQRVKRSWTYSVVAGEGGGLLVVRLVREGTGWRARATRGDLTPKGTTELAVVGRSSSVGCGEMR